MIPDIAWPSFLPGVQQEGRRTSAVSPITRTAFASGRARVRRNFTAVPVVHEVSWVMTSEQAVLFEQWYESVLHDGTLWFSMEMNLPQGSGPWAFRFADIYNGPEIAGSLSTKRWRYTAALEQWLRPVDSSPEKTFRVLEDGRYRDAGPSVYRTQESEK